MENIKYTISLILFFAINQQVCSQNWQWANKAGGTGYDTGSSVAEDNSGNVYATFNIDGPIAYFQTDTFTVNGWDDFFLVKYDNNGNELWVKQFGGSYNSSTIIKSEGAGGLKYDANSNSIYISGSFIGTCNMGSVTLTTFGNDKNWFIAKFDLNGNCLWAKNIGNPYSDDIYGLAFNLTPIGDIFFTKTFNGVGYIDTVMVSGGGFLGKIDNNGTLIWVKNIINAVPSSLSGGSGSGALPFSLSYFNNEIFILSYKGADTCIVDSTIPFISAANYPLILSKFSIQGNVISAIQAGGPFPDGSRLSMDNSGNCYFASRFSGGIAIFGNDTIHATGTTDFFFAKYDQNLNYQWVQQSHTSNTARAIGCSADANGNVYITGSFSGNATFGTFNITSNTSEDMFIARYDNIGNCIGVRHEGQGFGYDILTTQDGSCIVTGNYNGNITFSGIPTLTGYGGNDIFIAKSDAITGIGEGGRLANNQLIIYANPNQGKCNITIPDDFLNEANLVLSIYDNTGKLIQQKTLEMNGGNIKLNLEQEAKGVYNVVLSNKKKSYNGKIVFE